MKRREFLKVSSAAAATALAGPGVSGAATPGRSVLRGDEAPFRISLAGWSLHLRHFKENKLPLLDFPKVAREEFDIDGIELVNTMCGAPTYGRLRRLMAQAEHHKVEIVLIMVDDEGNLSASNREDRLQAVRNHHKWIDAASVLGCHCIRVNTGGAPNDERAIRDCADSLRRLAAYGMEGGVDIVCENHGGLSSHPASMARLMKAADSSHVGTLPDFGNFPANVDRYEAIASMMPWAKAVSAKCYEFDGDGQSKVVDFPRMMDIVLDAGYSGWVGIEYEGKRLNEHDGITAAKKLLESIAAGRSPAPTP